LGLGLAFTANLAKDLWPALSSVCKNLPVFID